MRERNDSYERGMKMGWLWTRKQRKVFYADRSAILWILHDLAYAAAHGHVADDKLIRMGTRANGLVARHGHLVRRKTRNGLPCGLFPAPREGFPKLKQVKVEDDEE